MFGEKDMYYKNGKKKFSDNNIRKKQNNQKDINMFVAQENSEIQIAESVRTLNQTSEANNTNMDDFASLEQQDFHVGEGLVSR